MIMNSKEVDRGRHSGTTTTKKNMQKIKTINEWEKISFISFYCHVGKSFLVQK